MPTWVIVLLSKSVALIVISNGLGHLRRQLAFYNYLTSQDYKVTIFCHLDDLRRLGALNINAEQLEIRVANLPNLVKDGFFETFSTELDKFDIVVSDNCIDILRSRKNTILFASFFWHRAISMPDWYYKESEELIDKCNPLIIANRLFVAEYLQSYNRLYLVGFFGNEPNKLIHTKNHLLLSFGFSNELNDYFTEIRDYVINFSLKKERKLWLEPRYFRSLKVKYDFIHEATYTDEMFASIDIGIIRPGIGTISNLFAARSKIICVHEENNLEMQTNSYRIYKNKYGVMAPNIEMIDKYLNSPDTIPRINYETAKKEFNGELDSFKVIESIG